MFAACSLALIFILKLRFPKTYSIKDIITRRYGNRTLGVFRQYEKAKFKLEKAKLDIDFLKKCKHFEVSPVFTVQATFVATTFVVPPINNVSYDFFAQNHATSFIALER